MVLYEYLSNGIIVTKISHSNILKATFYRYCAMLIPFFIMLIISYLIFGIEHNTVLFFSYIEIVIFLLGFPYIYLTLKYNHSYSYEFNDYSILLLIMFKNIKNNKKHNRRIKKVFLSFVVVFFFSQLMVLFMENQFNLFHEAFSKLFIEKESWFAYYKNIFLILLNLMFLVDVTIGLIGYIFSSRWLGNRTKSVDFTFLGWSAALICYPPFNALAGTYIHYPQYASYELFTNEIILAIFYFIIICLYTIYVWGTLELGLKFSNLTNKGIVTGGPYRYLRHPAYTTKNLAWWFENTFVLTNLLASLSLLVWNFIYILRGITEEKHLEKDPKYQKYQNKVKYRFIPGIY
jgi:protein-S-isoprenylcysteine O-methyltransferase Ste14